MTIRQRLSQEQKASLTFGNQCNSSYQQAKKGKKKKKGRKVTQSYHIISTDVEKAFDKIYHPFMGKNTQQLGVENVLYLIQSIHEEPIASDMLAFQGQEQGKNIHSSLFSGAVLEVIARTQWQKKK